MKLRHFFKSIPFLSTFLLIIFLNLNNQKASTKLRILIWNTPTYSLGTYLAISTGAGFILSYLITTNTAKLYQTNQYQTLKFKEKRIDENSYEISEPSTNTSYDNTLIERDIKDPSPTIDASFRIIGRTERSYNYKTSNNDEAQYEGAFGFEEDLDEQFVKNETVKQPNPIMSDWDDETYSAW